MSIQDCEMLLYIFFIFLIPVDCFCHVMDTIVFQQHLMEHSYTEVSACGRRTDFMKCFSFIAGLVLCWASLMDSALCYCCLCNS